MNLLSLWVFENHAFHLFPHGFIELKSTEFPQQFFFKLGFFDALYRTTTFLKLNSETFISLEIGGFEIIKLDSLFVDSVAVRINIKRAIRNIRSNTFSKLFKISIR